MSAILAVLTQEAVNGLLARTAGDLRLFGPELVLVTVVCGLLLADLFVPRAQSRRLAWLAGAGVLAALAPLIARELAASGSLASPESPSSAMSLSFRLFGDMIVIDRLGGFFGAIFLAGTLVTIVLATLSRELDGRPMGEFYALLLCATLGAMILVEANDLLVLFLGLELLSLPSYVLAGFVKRSRASSEAALKYVIYGSVASGVMLYGLSLFFGMTGSMKLDAIAALASGLQAQTPGPVPAAAVTVAGLLVLAGFAFKITAVPFHFWAPDVYQGAPTAVTAWLAVVSKAAGIGALLRFLGALGLGRAGAGLAPQVATSIDWVLLLALLSAVTMTLANLAGLFQRNVKRLLAYSSIAHVGYILVGIAAYGAPAASGGGPRSVAFYVAVYLLMNAGAFACVVLVANETKSESIEAFRGLSRRAPGLAIAMALFLAALVGIPPTAGFSGKLQVFASALSVTAPAAGGGVTHPLLWLVVVAAINTAVSAYYYMRVVKAMFFDEGPAEALPVPMLGRGLVWGLAAMTLWMGVFFEPLLAWSGAIAKG